jgi:predicted Rossmann-fold nucleotide-binding protein
METLKFFNKIPIILNLWKFQKKYLRFLRGSQLRQYNRGEKQGGKIIFTIWKTWKKMEIFDKR